MRTLSRFALGLAVGIVFVATIRFAFGGWPAGGSICDMLREGKN